MPQAVAQRLFEQFGLRYVEGYGLTETAAPSHSNPPDAPKQQCLGIPFMGCDARVVDPETLQQLPAGEQGEIIIHGPMVFDGYWKHPEATAAAFIRYDGKRFFRSGDLGHMDDEGYFFLTDRLKRMINASGFKVWPAEVEALMFRHPAIQEGCVIAARDAYSGQGCGGAACRPPGPGRRPGHHCLVPREHGCLQGAADHRVRRDPAQERQWQGDVAQIAGSRRKLKRKDDEVRWRTALSDSTYTHAAAQHLGCLHSRMFAVVGTG